MSELSFMEYSIRAKETAIYPNAGKDFMYPCLGLKGEIGEVCELMKKAIRDEEGRLSEERMGKLKKELGDVAWYLAAILRTIPRNCTISVELMLPSMQGYTPNERPELIPAIRQMEKLAYEACQLSPDVKGDKLEYGELITSCYERWRNVCMALGFNPSDVLEANLEKLFDRKDRGVLKGSGDDR